MPEEHPILALPRAEQVPTRAPAPRQARGAKGPRKARQVERLTPRFAELQAAIAEKRASLQVDPGGVAPEQVLVLETNGPVKELVDAVTSTPGLQWLAEEVSEVAPDGDFFIADKPGKVLSARLYMVMTNQAALEQIVSLWALWTKSKRSKVPRAWTKVFRQLRDVRRWGASDRLHETGIFQDWEERKRAGAGSAPVEIELWFRTPEQREAASRRVTACVHAAQGQVLGSTTIAEIQYHALLARLPAASVEGLVGDQGVQLLKADDVRLFRPLPQASVVRPTQAPADDAPSLSPPGRLGEPVVALLDGLPLENHSHLQGRLRVEDPDGWAARYPAGNRFHGTAMAGLILHGDLSSPTGTSQNELYVRPILFPDDQGNERAPEDRLWVDLIHRAVRRIVVGDGSAPSAPGVRIVNLSVGDKFQPFVDTAVSPLARLLDWLSWKYGLLFIVSAGNHPGAIVVDEDSSEHGGFETGLIKALQKSHRHRRLLSPAESINALTVGSLHHDEAGPFSPRYAEDRFLVTTDGMPAPYSALGRGFRMAVKPDVFAPGGRAVYARQLGSPPGPKSYRRVERPLEVPGTRVAAPSPRGTLYSYGTSNAAAETTRVAEGLLSVVRAVVSNVPHLREVPEALLVKALLVHTAEWAGGAYEVVRRALRTPENASIFDDLVSAFLGYGVLRSERAHACTPDRVTLLGGEVIGEGETRLHRIPLPAALNAFTSRRKLTTTLAWFSPINPNHRKYRCAALSFVPLKDGRTPLLLGNADVHLNAVKRGTIQHVVLERDSGAINVRENDALEVAVTCEFESQSGMGIRVPYALAVTLEVAPGLAVPIYDAVREMVRPRVRSR